MTETPGKAREAAVETINSPSTHEASHTATEEQAQQLADAHARLAELEAERDEALRLGDGLAAQLEAMLALWQRQQAERDALAAALRRETLE